MRRFLTEKEGYERVNLREDEFEALVPTYVRILIPGIRWGNWKPLVDSPHGRVRPDAVILNPELDRWWVVEVELASHPEVHFRDQFNALCDGYYGRHLSASLAASLPNVEEGHLDQLLTTERPGFLCIADEASQPLTDACMDYGFQLAVMTPFRSDLGRFGMMVSRFPRDLATTRRSLVFALTLESAWGGRLLAELPKTFPDHESIQVRFEDAVHELRVTAVGQKRRVFLPVAYKPRQGFPSLLVSIDPVRRLYELHGGETP